MKWGRYRRTTISWVDNYKFKIILRIFQLSS